MFGSRNCIFDFCSYSILNCSNFSSAFFLFPYSLKKAIDMAFGFMLCSEKNPIRICKHCGKVFYAKNPKAEYDSSQCRNQANVYKSRNKNKAD